MSAAICGMQEFPDVAVLIQATLAIFVKLSITYKLTTCC
jgi:hypothetical protein